MPYEPSHFDKGFQFRERDKDRIGNKLPDGPVPNPFSKGPNGLGPEAETSYMVYGKISDARRKMGSHDKWDIVDRLPAFLGIPEDQLHHTGVDLDWDGAYTIALLSPVKSERLGSWRDNSVANSAPEDRQMAAFPKAFTVDEILGRRAHARDSVESQASALVAKLLE